MTSWISFAHCCRAGAAVLLVLACVLLVYPPFVFGLFEINGGASASFLTRRAALLLLGLSVTLWLARGAPPSPARRAVARGTAAAMLGLGVLGTVEFVRGVAGPGIWVAIGVEAALGLSLLWTERTEPPARP